MMFKSLIAAAKSVFQARGTAQEHPLETEAKFNLLHGKADLGRHLAILYRGIRIGEENFADLYSRCLHHTGTVVTPFNALQRFQTRLELVQYFLATLDLPGARGAVKLSDLRGKVVYVDFWASWCAPCKQSFPWLNEMQARYGAHGLEIVGINVDARRTDADRFLAQVPARFTLAFDARGDTPGCYAAKGMPTSFLIARDGTIVATHVGFRAEDKSRIEREIRRALGVN